MKEVASNKENINLLWTGGWDSTFQLLQLLLIHRRRVTPFYLIDAERRSTGVEIQTMKRIKDHILKEYPHTHELFKPTQYFAVSDISPDSQITEAHQAILKEKHIGSQYDWLARFCKENKVSDIQLCAEKSSNPDKERFSIDKILEESHDGCETIFRIDQILKNTNENVLFRYFTFPLNNLTKIDMFEIVKKHGWQEIMNMTWFCHNPTCDIKPCGKCTPCLQVIKEGFGWRIPLKSRIVSFFYKYFILPLKSLLKSILK